MEEVCLPIVNGSDVYSVGASTETMDETVDNQLLEAVLAGDLNLVRTALDDGANIHVRSHCNYTPLMHAVSIGNWEVLKLLLEKGAAIGDDLGVCNVLTTLCESTCQDNLSLLKCLNLLLEAGADPSAPDWMGTTPLINAVQRNREQLALRLIHTGCSINAPDSEGWTPLFHAVLSNNVSMAQLLIDCGAKINLMDSSGRTLSDIASCTNNRELVKMVTTQLKPEYVLNETSTNTHQSRSLTSPFRSVLNEGPKTNDRLYGFHDDAIQFLRGIGLGHVASVMSTQNLQFAALLTWDQDNWSAAGIHLTYHRKKLHTCVRQYHEKEWSRDAIPDFSNVYEGEKVNLFGAVQALASFVRMTHISSASSLYLLKNFDNEQLPEEIIEQLQSVAVTLAVIKKQIAIITKICHNLEKNDRVYCPDLISSTKHDSKFFNPHLALSCLVGAVSLCCLIKLRY